MFRAIFRSVALLALAGTVWLGATDGFGRPRVGLRTGATPPSLDSQVGEGPFETADFANG